MIQCTIIIPVYNSFVSAQRCLESVIHNLPMWANILVLDDCSPDGDFRAKLPIALQSHSSIRFLRNRTNLGFIGTCNRGMLMHTTADIVLLNSDTVATPRWLEKLRAAAYSNPTIGTVTPLTNNGTIASVPVFLQNNSTPTPFTIDGFAALIERSSARLYPKLPTCVGFCTYIRRDLLSEIGGFDPHFGKGYGEENDFSLRARQKGFINILDDATFIFHIGNMSFADLREVLTKENADRLSTRYPYYNREIAEFCVTNPLQDIHHRIWNPLQEQFIANREKTVLHILHNGPKTPRQYPIGGTEVHVQSIISHDTSTAHFTLVPYGEVLYLTAHTPYGDREITLPGSFDLSCLLSKSYFDLIHIHHTLGFDLERLTEALILHGNYVVSIHDYWLICDKIFLQARDDSVCDGIRCGFSCENEPGGIKKKRALAREMLRGANEVIAFSSSSQDILLRTLQESFRFHIIPHGVILPTRSAPQIPDLSAGEPIRVLSFGTLAKHKGLEILKTLFKLETLPCGRPLEWHLIGSDEQIDPRVIVHGRYNPQTLQTMIHAAQPHCAVLVPQCQETYSVALDELIWCGIPVITTPFGALPERINQWKVGLVAENTSLSIMQSIDTLVTDNDLYIKLRHNASNAPILSIQDEIAHYTMLYAEHAPHKRAESGALMKFLQPGFAS